MQNLATKVTGNSLPASEWNQVPQEIQNVILASGQALSAGDLNQLGKAIAFYTSVGTFYADSGLANSYVLAQTGLRQATPSLADGAEIVIKWEY